MLPDKTYAESNRQKKLKFDKLCVPTMDGFDLINTTSIVYLQADNAYTILYLENEKIVSSKNLGYYEVELQNEPFLRIHNSFMVNMCKVIKYIRGDEGFVVMENKKIIKVSRSRKDELFDFFISARTTNH